MGIKKTVYIILSIILGIIISYLLHAVIEIIVLRNPCDSLVWYTHFGIRACALHPVVQYGLLIIGIAGGFFMGRSWWKIVYIEKRHWSFKNNN